MKNNGFQCLSIYLFFEDDKDKILLEMNGHYFKFLERP